MHACLDAWPINETALCIIGCMAHQWMARRINGCVGTLPELSQRLPCVKRVCQVTPVIKFLKSNDDKNQS